MAITLRDAGRLAEALPLLDQAYELSSRLSGENSSIALSIAEARAVLYLLDGRTSDAEPVLQRTLSFWGQDGQHTSRTREARTSARLAHLCLVKRDFAQALYFGGRAMEIQQAILPTDHPDIAYSRSLLARAKQALGYKSEALDEAHAAVATLEVKVVEGHPWLRDARATLASLETKTQ